MASGRAFGELAILYNCTRTASVKGIEIMSYLTKIIKCYGTERWQRFCGFERKLTYNIYICCNYFTYVWHLVLVYWLGDFRGWRV